MCDVWLFLLHVTLLVIKGKELVTFVLCNPFSLTRYYVCGHICTPGHSRCSLESGNPPAETQRSKYWAGKGYM